MSITRIGHLPRRLAGRTVRWRLTLVCGALVLASGAVLLCVTAVLWGRAKIASFDSFVPASDRLWRIFAPPGRGSIRLRSALADAPPPQLVVGPGSIPIRAAVDAPNQASPATTRRVVEQLQAVATAQQSNDLHQLLLYSSIALSITAVLALALGWWIAGRLLRPLRTITATAKDISASDLHERLDLRGPDDELRQLGGTIDELLERLERSFEAQRQFVANASHELRTPIATMRASLDVALAKPVPIPA